MTHELDEDAARAPRLVGKVVVITGASSGIGEATARRLAAAGASVVLGARGEDRLRAVADAVSAAGGSVASRPTDVRRRDDVAALVALACQRFGRLDALVSNAGVMPVSPLDDLRIGEWEEMIDINLRGVLFGVAAALPVFRSQGFGHFVHLASTAATTVMPTMAVYAGTKAAIRAISEGLRQEAAGDYRVTVITPGMTRTNFADTITNDATREQLTQRRDAQAQSPDAVAVAIAFAIEQPDEVDVSEIVIRPRS